MMFLNLSRYWPEMEGFIQFRSGISHLKQALAALIAMENTLNQSLLPSTDWLWKSVTTKNGMDHRTQVVYNLKEHHNTCQQICDEYIVDTEWALENNVCITNEELAVHLDHNLWDFEVGSLGAHCEAVVLDHDHFEEGMVDEIVMRDHTLPDWIVTLWDCSALNCDSLKPDHTSLVLWWGVIRFGRRTFLQQITVMEDDMAILQQLSLSGMLRREVSLSGEEQSLLPHCRLLKSYRGHSSQ
eukprot:Gb_02583 [translate_table: standard]